MLPLYAGSPESDPPLSLKPGYHIHIEVMYWGIALVVNQLLGFQKILKGLPFECHNAYVTPD